MSNLYSQHFAEQLRQIERKRKLFSGNAGPWYEHLMEDEGLTQNSAEKMMSAYEMIPYIDPQYGHMATLAKNKKEVHFAIFRRFRGKMKMGRAGMYRWLQEILDREAFLVTKLGTGEDERFIKHLGFVQIATGGMEVDNVRQPGYRFYMLTTIRRKGKSNEPTLCNAANRPLHRWLRANR